MDEEDLAWARFQHEIYMRNLITIIVEGDMTALVRYAMDLDLREREGTPTATPSGSAGSGSSTDGAAQVELSDPTSRQALVGIGRIFETVANHITAYRNDPERGYILRYPHGYAQSDVEYLYGVAAMRFRGNAQRMEEEVERLMEQNQMVNEFMV